MVTAEDWRCADGLGGDVSQATAEDEELVADLDELYRALAKPLERLVRFGAYAPEPVIEDACQFAWSRLVFHRHRIRRATALGWLAQTAIRQARKLMQRRDRELPLEAAETAFAPGPAELAEQRERLAGLGALSARQQRLLWLSGLGLTYEEIATQDRCSRRTVDRQLRRARTLLRAAEA